MNLYPHLHQNQIMSPKRTTRVSGGTAKKAAAETLAAQRVAVQQALAKPVRGGTSKSSGEASAKTVVAERPIIEQLFVSHMRNRQQKPLSPFQKLNGATSQKQSVGTKFKDQLFKLMQQLENTTPHFIRCVKPNSQHLPGLYEIDLVLQ